MARLRRFALVFLLAVVAPTGFAQRDDTPRDAASEAQSDDPAAQPDDPAPQADDEAALDARLAALRARVCEADSALCRELNAFAGANPPCLPQGERLSVGHARIIDDDAGVTAAEYFVLRTQRVRDVTLVQTQHVYSENEEEKQAAEALILALKAGTPAPDNLLYQYVQAQRQQVPELMAQREARALVVRSEGPTVYLRQAGKLLFAALPGGRFSAPGQAEQRAGVLFVTLPAPASCQ
jgi:hypothetical protein